MSRSLKTRIEKLEEEVSLAVVPPFPGNPDDLPARVLWELNHGGSLEELILASMEPEGENS